MLARGVSRPLTTGSWLALACCSGLAGQSEKELRLIEDFRFGGVSGPQALTEVGSVLPSRDGKRLFIAQHQDARVIILDVKSKQVVGTIGGRGKGPGEFDRVGPLGWKQDTLYAVDRILQRVVFFSENGEHIRTERLVSSKILPQTRRAALPLALAPDGTVIADGLINLSAAAQGRTTSNPLIRMTRTGELLSMFAPINIEGAFHASAGGGRLFVGKRRFGSMDLRAVAPDGSSLAVVEIRPDADAGPTFFVTRMGFQGDTLYHRAFRFEPRPVPSELRDSIYAASAEWWAKRNHVSPRRARQLAEETLELSETQAPVSTLVLGKDGTAWLRRERQALGVAHWMVLDPQGRFRGTVRTSASLQIKHVDGETVWAILRGSLDEPYISRARVVPVGGH